MHTPTSGILTTGNLGSARTTTNSSHGNGLPVTPEPAQSPVKQRITSQVSVSVDRVQLSTATDPKQVALSLVQKTLSAAYEAMSFKTQEKSSAAGIVKGYNTSNVLTPEKVAGTILGFIDRRLQLDAAEGADADALRSRLEAGMKGFQKGFAEAEERLKALSLLNPEIATEIGKTYDLVMKGIDDLRVKWLGEDSAPLTTTQPATTSRSPSMKTAAASISADKLRELIIPSINTDSSAQYGIARSLSFSVTTKEGDVVTINASASQGRVKTDSGDQISSSDHLEYSIEGDLSDEEKQAIHSLFERIQTLASDFFNGDLDKAFSAAQELGFDNNVIAGYSLSIAQAQVQVANVYEAESRPVVSPSTGHSLADMKEPLFPLGNFIKLWLETINEASIFRNPANVVNDIAANMIEGDVERARFTEFVDKLPAPQANSTQES